MVLKKLEIVKEIGVILFLLFIYTITKLIVHVIIQFKSNLDKRHHFI